MIYLKKNEISYKLKNNYHFISRNIKSVYPGSETVYLEPKIWNLLPENIKDSGSFISFRVKIKFWKPESCPCG